MISGQVLKKDIIDNGKSLRECSKILNMYIDELEALFLNELDENDYYELCEKLQLIHIVPHGMSKKALDKFNDMVMLSKRLNNQLEETILILKQVQNLNKNQQDQINKLKEQNKILSEKNIYQIEVNLELENKLKNFI